MAENAVINIANALQKRSGLPFAVSAVCGMRSARVYGALAFKGSTKPRRER